MDAEMDAYWLGSDKGKEKLDAEMDEYWATARKDQGTDDAEGGDAHDGEGEVEGEEIQE